MVMEEMRLLAEGAWQEQAVGVSREQIAPPEGRVVGTKQEKPPQGKKSCSRPPPSSSKKQAGSE